MTSPAMNNGYRFESMQSSGMRHLDNTQLSLKLIKINMHLNKCLTTKYVADRAYHQHNAQFKKNRESASTSG